MVDGYNYSWVYKNYEIRTRHVVKTDRTSPVYKSIPFEIIKHLDDNEEFEFTIGCWKWTGNEYVFCFSHQNSPSFIENEDLLAIWRQILITTELIARTIK